MYYILFGVLRHFQHCTGHVTTGSWNSRGNQYIQFLRVLYCKLLTNGKQLPAFPLEAMPGIEPRPQRWEARVLPLCHLGPSLHCCSLFHVLSLKFLLFNPINRTKWWKIKVKHLSLDIYWKNISLMKINNIILLLRTGVILSSSFVIYFFLYMSFGKFFLF